MPASIANRRDMHTVQLPEDTFRAPETAHTELYLLHALRESCEHLLPAYEVCMTFGQARINAHGETCYF